METIFYERFGAKCRFPLLSGHFMLNLNCGTAVYGAFVSVEKFCCVAKHGTGRYFSPHASLPSFIVLNVHVCVSEIISVLQLFLNYVLY